MLTLPHGERLERHHNDPLTDEARRERSPFPATKSEFVFRLTTVQNTSQIMDTLLTV